MKCIATISIGVMALGASVAAWQLAPLALAPIAAAPSGPAAPPGSAADAFDDFCRRNFGAEKEELIYTACGKELKFDAAGDWVHASVRSACIGFETALPAQSYVEFGLTTAYGQSTKAKGNSPIFADPKIGTVPTKAGERFCYLHLHYLSGLEPGRRYHYRLQATDERGNRSASADRILATMPDVGILHIPDDVLGPPYVLDRAKATYLLTKDLLIDGRALQIKAPGITLDLGGHTVVYDNVHMGPPGGPGDFPLFIAKSSFGVLVQGNDFKILNGTIRQGAGQDAAQANAIGFNPIYVGGEPGEIAGTTLEYAGEQITGICTHWAETCHIHHTVVRDRGDAITDRHQGCDGIGMLGRPAQGTLHHNLLWRVRHRGLGGKNVYHNEIYGDSFATNSYAISVAPGGNYYGNRIFGTGYHFVGFSWANGITVHDNLILVQGSQPNQRSREYGDQESGNGIRLTQYAGATVPYEDLCYYGNTIVVKGRQGCQVRGVQFFSDPHVKNLVFRNNIVKAIVEDAETQQASCVVTQGNADRTEGMLAILYQDNTFISNFTHVRFGDYYGVGSNHRFLRCKFVKIGDDPRYRTFYYETNQPCKKHVLLDCTFAGGASLDSVGWADHAADDDFTVQWTLTVQTTPGAAVAIRDRSGSEVLRRAADQAGRVSAALSQYVQRPGGRTYLTPHTVVCANGGKSASATVSMDRGQTVELSVP